MCNRLERVQSGQGSRHDRTKRSRDVVSKKGADQWASGKRDDGGKKGGKKGLKGSKLDWHSDKDKGVQSKQRQRERQR